MKTISQNTKCSRCPRVEQQEVSIEQLVAEAKKTQGDARTPPALEIRIDGKPVVLFETLCTTCKVIVARHTEHAGVKPTHQSSLRERTEKPPEGVFREKMPEKFPEKTPAKKG